MVSLSNLAFAISIISNVCFAAPSQMHARQDFVPGVQNKTQEFYIRLKVTDGLRKYDGWSLEAYHTGAGLADPVFVSGIGSPAFLNHTNLQFDVNQYPFSMNGFPSDTNYARWEPVSINSGYGSGYFVNNGTDGIEVDQAEFDGWLVCEWFHGDNLPQLFQMIKGFDAVSELGTCDIPSSCARVHLFAEYI